MKWVQRCFLKGVLMEWIGRERSIEGREFHKQGTRQEKELRSASVENGLRFNLDDSAERVLDEQKENGCKMGRLCIGFLQGRRHRYGWYGHGRINHRYGWYGHGRTSFCLKKMADDARNIPLVHWGRQRFVSASCPPRVHTINKWSLRTMYAWFPLVSISHVKNSSSIIPLNHSLIF